MRTREEKIFQIIGNIVMMIASLLVIIPMILLLSSSFTDNDALIRDGYRFIPTVFGLDSYAYVFSTGDSIVLAYISFLVTFVGTVCLLIMTILLAYPLSRRGVPLGGVSFFVFFTMLFNGGLVPDLYHVYPLPAHQEHPLGAPNPLPPGQRLLRHHDAHLLQYQHSRSGYRSRPD